MLRTCAPGQTFHWAQAPGQNMVQLGSLALSLWQAKAPCLWWNSAVAPSGDGCDGVMADWALGQVEWGWWAPWV